MHADEAACLKALNHYADLCDPSPATTEALLGEGWVRDSSHDPEVHHPKIQDLALTEAGTLYLVMEEIARQATMGQVRMMVEVLTKQPERSY